MAIAVEEDPNRWGGVELFSIGLDLGQGWCHHIDLDAAR